MTTSKHRALAAALISSLIFGVSSNAFADPSHGKGHDKAHEKSEHKEAKHKHKASHSTSTSSQEPSVQVTTDGRNWQLTVSTARQYATEYQLVQGKPLPPGIRKQLQRGKPLPPGLAKQRLPVEYIERLPVRENCEWQRIGTDLVLVAVTTGLVVELLNDVFN